MKAEIRSMARGILVVAVLTMLSACGGGDSGAPPPPTQTVGGTVSGLTGSGSAIQFVGVNDTRGR